MVQSMCVTKSAVPGRRRADEVRPLRHDEWLALDGLLEELGNA